jgi:hypothetical protein
MWDYWLETCRLEDGHQPQVSAAQRKRVASPFLPFLEFTMKARHRVKGSSLWLGLPHNT